jgi:hypothetical protein
MKCYYCDNEGITDEHLPPKCIFPKGNNYQLITVKSCKQHNNEKSGDDEYFRNIISMMIDTNEYGIKHFSSKTIRSLIRNRNSDCNILKKSIPILLNGEKTYATEIDSNRFHKYISKMASGFYFYHFDMTYNNDWDIFIQTKLINTESVYDMAYFKILNDYAKFQDAFVQQITHNIEIFKYYIFKFKDMVVFKFVFYGGVNIFCSSNCSLHKVILNISNSK